MDEEGKRKRMSGRVIREKHKTNRLVTVLLVVSLIKGKASWLRSRRVIYYYLTATLTHSLTRGALRELSPWTGLGAVEYM